MAGMEDEVRYMAEDLLLLRGNFDSKVTSLEEQRVSLLFPTADTTT